MVDCHSFNDKPDYPDICIGFNDDTPQYSVNNFKYHFESNGYSVALNFPYANAIVPKVKGEVESLMVEINKRLYLTTENQIDNEKVARLNSVIRNIFEFDDL